MAEGGTTAWDETLDPWRRVSALVAAVQAPAIAAAMLLVFFARDSARGWAFAATAAVVVLELVQVVLARAALRGVPDSVPAQLYASLPLGERERRLVSSALLMALAAPAVLLAVMPANSYFKDHLVLAALLLVAAGASSFLSLYRIWRHNSWLAVSRIPAQPRTSHPRYRSPGTG